MADLGNEPSFSLDDAVRLLESGDLDHAIGAFQRYLRISPDSFVAHLKLAQAYQKKALTGERLLWKLAERECSAAIRLAPPDQAAHEALIEIAVKLGLGGVLRTQYETKYRSLPFAAECIEKVRSLNPNYGAETLRAVFTGVAGFVRANAGWVIIAGIALGAGWWITQRRPEPGPESFNHDFTLRDLAGEQVSLSSFCGDKVVVLDFWATWCPPCRQSLPAMHDLRQRYLAKGVEFLSVDLREDGETVRKYIDSQALELHVLLDSDGAAARAFGVSGIPAIFVLDKEGKIRHKQVGWAPGLETGLESAIKSLL